MDRGQRTAINTVIQVLYITNAEIGAGTNGAHERSTKRNQEEDFDSHCTLL